MISASVAWAAGHPGNVDTVIVAGRIRKRHGQLIDKETVSSAVEAARESRRRLLTAAGI
jgi:5-methylthioadenosine/S-adenosylhomocysteine deaminase